MLEFHEPLVAHSGCWAVVWQSHPRCTSCVSLFFLGIIFLQCSWEFLVHFDFFPPQQTNENSITPWSWQSQNLVQQNKSLDLFDLLPCLRQDQPNGKAGDVPKYSSQNIYLPYWQSVIQSTSAPLFLLNQDGFSFELWSTWGFCCLLTGAVLSHSVSGVQKGEFFPPFQQHPEQVVTVIPHYAAAGFPCSFSITAAPHFLPIKPGNSWMEQVSLLGQNDWFLQFFHDP